MSDPYLDDLEFANKANIAAARKFKAERDALVILLEWIMNCIVCGGDHAPRAESCDSGGMNLLAAKLGARRWNALTAHISRINNKVGPMVPWMLDCQREVCAAPECDCPALTLHEGRKP
jgi:hypothetical protein